MEEKAAGKHASPRPRVAPPGSAAGVENAPSAGTQAMLEALPATSPGPRCKRTLSIVPSILATARGRHPVSPPTQSPGHAAASVSTRGFPRCLQKLLEDCEGWGQSLRTMRENLSACPMPSLSPLPTSVSPLSSGGRTPPALSLGGSPETLSKGSACRPDVPTFGLSLCPVFWDKAPLSLGYTLSSLKRCG